MQKKFASLTMIHTSVSSNYRNVLLTDTSVPTNFSEGKTKLWTKQRRPVTDHPRPQLPHHCQWIWCLLTVKLSINHDPKTGPECPIVEKDWVSMSKYFDIAFCYRKQWFEMMIYDVLMVSYWHTRLIRCHIVIMMYSDILILWWSSIVDFTFLVILWSGNLPKNSPLH